MITDPAIIFLDEPSSGLDSFTAYRIVRMLRNFARMGKTVISTIHQPGSDSYAMFDKLLIRAQGRTMYHGPALETQAFFTDLGY